jgi:zinc transport system ATP-binding protein
MARADQADIVTLDGVWVTYNGTTALEDVNLSVKQEDFVGIIGPNGGGKSTLMKTILGLQAPTRGSVLVSGRPPEKARKAIGYVPQLRNYDWAFPINVWDLVSMGLYGGRGLFRRYRREDRERVAEALEAAGISDLCNRQIGALSGGQQQRAFVARALVGDPGLLLLDEAMSGVDAATRTEFYELLTELNHRATIVMVSHDISAVSAYAKTLACLNRRLYYHGTRELPLEDIEATYGCPVEMIAHGMPHRVLHEHQLE